VFVQAAEDFVITHDSVETHGVIRWLLKKAHFEDIHGEGAVELDALEALRPDHLRELLTHAIHRYWDPTLVRRTAQKATEVEAEIDAVNDDVHHRHAPEYRAIKEKYDAHRDAFLATIAPLRAEHEALSAIVERELTDEQPDLEEVAWPQSRTPNEFDDPLYDSRRDYLEQLRAYKEFQGKPTESEKANATSDSIAHILELSAQGMSKAEIARKIGKGKVWVGRVVNAGGRPPRLPHNKVKAKPPKKPAPKPGKKSVKRTKKRGK
jgi:hypothetical protein